MATAEPDLPPYEPQRILSARFPERVRLACRTWASQINPTPFSVIVMYWAKYFLVYIAGWAFFVSFNANYSEVGGFTAPADWAFSLTAFQKAVLWSLFYEISGLGCSSGPMNARFIPPIGGLLYFLRPGTTKLPLFPGLPIVGGIRRTPLDVAVLAALLLFLLRGLIAPELTALHLLPCIVLLPILGIMDKTVFLAARGEHYYVALVCLFVAMEGDVWISACKVVWGAIWFWAATSKLNHHFPSVIMVMMNNGPFFPSWLKKRLFASYPDDLRPSAMAKAMAFGGTLTEYMIPLVLLTSESAGVTGLALFVMCGFHGFISANNPSGMPIEWNILMVYGGIFLFGFHPEASILALGSLPWLAAFLFVCLFAIPCYGNFVPSRVSFLFAMRYYAGNWAYNVWLFRKGSSDKLHQLKKPAGSMREQLAKMLPDEETVDLAVAMSLSHRFMHLEGRPLLDALPKAVDDIEDYEWVEGEVLGGSVIGWNFGDGHLSDTQLLDAIQAQCHFEAGELRVVMIESQPLFGRSMKWKVVDAKTGLVDQGETLIASMHALQPWPEGEHAAAYGSRGRA